MAAWSEIRGMSNERFERFFPIMQALYSRYWRHSNRFAWCYNHTQHNTTAWSTPHQRRWVLRHPIWPLSADAVLHR